MARKSKPRELKVIFDTNVLFTKVASDLVRNEVQKLILDNSSHVDLVIKWILPEVVVNERKYQMEKRAFEYMPTVNKLERLLGHKLNITEDILVNRVDNAISKNIEDFNINIAKLRTDNVEWDEIIQRATSRKPPFETNESEKGFRDVLIGQTFLQTVRNSPVSPSICLLALVTEDILLQEYVNEKTQDSKNIRLVNNVSDIESLINTLVSNVTEDFVKELSEKARKFFFIEGDKSTYYFKEKITDKIDNKFEVELKTSPFGKGTVKLDNWYINNPIFLSKKGQKTNWLSSIEIEAEVITYEFPKKQAIEPPSINKMFEIFMKDKKDLGDVLMPLSKYEELYKKQKQEQQPKKGLLNLDWEKVTLGKGHFKFEVYWGATVKNARGRGKTLSAPSIEDIQFKGWEEREEDA